MQSGYWRNKNFKKKFDLIYGKEYGYVDIREGIELHQLPEAENTLILLLVAVYSNWKIRISYYFVESLKGYEKAVLVQTFLVILADTGVTVISITFDNLSNNLNMWKSLGINCNNKTEQFCEHPITK